MSSGMYTNLSSEEVCSTGESEGDDEGLGGGEPQHTFPILNYNQRQALAHFQREQDARHLRRQISENFSPLLPFFHSRIACNHSPFEEQQERNTRSVVDDAAAAGATGRIPESFLLASAMPSSGRTSSVDAGAYTPSALSDDESCSTTRATESQSRPPLSTATTASTPPSTHHARRWRDHHRVPPALTNAISGQGSWPDFCAANRSDPTLGGGNSLNDASYADAVPHSADHSTVPPFAAPTKVADSPSSLPVSLVDGCRDKMFPPSSAYCSRRRRDETFSRLSLSENAKGPRPPFAFRRALSSSSSSSATDAEASSEASRDLKRKRLSLQPALQEGGHLSYITDHIEGTALPYPSSGPPSSFPPGRRSAHDTQHCPSQFFALNPRSPHLKRRSPRTLYRRPLSEESTIRAVLRSRWRWLRKVCTKCGAAYDSSTEPCRRHPLRSSLRSIVSHATTRGCLITVPLCGILLLWMLLPLFGFPYISKVPLPRPQFHTGISTTDTLLESAKLLEDGFPSSRTQSSIERKENGAFGSPGLSTPPSLSLRSFVTDEGFSRLVTWRRQLLIQKRREIFRKFKTRYGCTADPTILYMQGLSKPRHQNTSLSEFSMPTLRGSSRFASLSSPPSQLTLLPTAVASKASYPSQASQPFRLALLFMITKELRHAKLWLQWLKEADRWGREMYRSREGPYEASGGENTDAEMPPYVPPYSLHVHFTAAPATRGVYKQLRKMLGRLNWFSGGDYDEIGLNQSQLSEEVTDPVNMLPAEFKNSLIPDVGCSWGDLNRCELHLLKTALEASPNVNGFIFLSESTVPVKPFWYIYREYQKNPRSRFYFSNVNLPLVRKHHQWIVLNRPHAALLVEHPQKWQCDSWLVHQYPSWFTHIPAYTAPDEYLPFYALSDLLGPDLILEQINRGSLADDDLFAYNHTGVIHGPRSFRHTWLCWWENPEFIETESCADVGEFTARLSSPVTYERLDAGRFRRLVIQNNVPWFARKFSSGCTVSDRGPPRIFRGSAVLIEDRKALSGGTDGAAAAAAPSESADEGNKTSSRAWRGARAFSFSPEMTIVMSELDQDWSSSSGASVERMNLSDFLIKELQAFDEQTPLYDSETGQLLPVH